MPRSTVGIRISGTALCALLLALLGHNAHAQQRNQTASIDPPKRIVAKRLEAPSRVEVTEGHPLASLVKYARDEQAYLRSTLRDFTCRVAKRERIEGDLQPLHHIQLEVREEVRQGNRVVQPFSVYGEFLAPAKVAGRKVLYVDGQNEGKMLVRNGGKRFNYVVVEIDPYSPTALKESQIPITEIGFNKMLDRLIYLLEKHMDLDPTGANTKLEKFVKAKINGRICTVVRVTHPEKRDGLDFHVANVYVDDELHVPVRLDASGWPEKAGEEPPLEAEYTYTNLRLNVGLSDAHFDPKRVRGR